MARTRSWLLPALLIALCAACAAPTPIAATQLPLPTPIANGYPGPGGAAPTGYPGPGTGVPLIPTNVAPSAPSEPPPAASGKAAISGVLFAPDTVGVIKGTIVYLAPTTDKTPDGVQPVLQDPDPQKGDFAGKTDLDGQFTLTDIAPGSYNLIVWAPLSWRVASKSATSQDPLVIKASADQRIALGVVYVAWP